MELLDNVNKTLKDDLGEAIKGGSKIAIAAAFFSIYAYQELKAELEGIDELRFIFTSPTFVTERLPRRAANFIFLAFKEKKAYTEPSSKLN